MSKLSILDIIDGTVVDGPGFRLSIYCAGCSHRCNGCHNPQSWEIGNGKEMDVEELLQVVKDSPWNVTFSGGDPFFQAEGFAQLAQRIKAETSKTVWCYTGYTLEALVQENDPWKMELLRSIDVLVDGPFVQDLRDEQLRFRGSANQRILDSEQIASLIGQVL
ncbi:MAG: anaerobic ribonucleoside-triphosphate reductase activating protein [Bacteroidales bacterium]|nr:anaerobic ribonucleoside-triphosphate reductase activating protein [Bacteroidales bacterium]